VRTLDPESRAFMELVLPNFGSGRTRHRSRLRHNAGLQGVAPSPQEGSCKSRDPNRPTGRARTKKGRALPRSEDSRRAAAEIAARRRRE